MGFRNRQSFAYLRLSGGTMTGALNMGAQSITNAGDITADNAAGYALLNEAATLTNPTVVPNRVDSTTGVTWNTSTIGLTAAGTNQLFSGGGGMTLPAGIALNVRASASSDVGNFVVNDDLTFNGADTDRGGATLTLLLNAMTATLSAASTHDFAAAIPAGATVVGVTTRVTTTITGCTSIQIGDGTDVDRFGNAIALTAGTTTTNADWTVTSAPVYAAATVIRITAVGGGASFTAGAMRVCVYYLAPTAPTS